MIVYHAGDIHGLPVQVQIPADHVFAKNLPAWQSAYDMFIKEFLAQNKQLEVNDWWRARGSVAAGENPVPGEWWIRISRAPQGYIVYPE